MRGEMPMTVTDLLPSRYYALAGATAVTVLASMAAVFDSWWLFVAGAAGVRCGARFHVCAWLHPVAVVPYRPLPDRGYHARSVAAARAGAGG